MPTFNYLHVYRYGEDLSTVLGMLTWSFFSFDSCRSRQPWLIRAMTVGSATESSVATGEILVTKAAPGVAGEDPSVQKGSPQYLIGKTQEELEEIAIALGEVRFHFWASFYKTL